MRSYRYNLVADVDYNKCEEPRPEISSFLGIVIRMYIREHYPAHFHVEYGEYEITVDIETGVVTGKFPKRALKAAMNRKPLSKIEPLE